MNTRRLATLLLTALGVIVGLMADPSQLALYTLAAAAVAALGARAGVLFGALTVVVGVGTAPTLLPIVTPLAILGSVLAGLALGLLGREIDRHVTLFARDQRALLVALAALLLALTFVWPDPHVQLASPLAFDALTVDTGTAMRLWRQIPAVVPYLSPLADIELLVLLLAGIVAFGGLAHAALRRQFDRVGQVIVLTTAGLGVLVAGVALLDLVFGSVPLDASLRQSLTTHASTAGPLLDLALPPSGTLALWSRPWVDGLRLVAALMLLAAPFVNAHSPTDTRPWLPVALAIAVIALPFVAAPMALAGGIALGLGALVAGRSGTASDLAPRIALVMLMVIWVWGALAPLPS